MFDKGGGATFRHFDRPQRNITTRGFGSRLSIPDNATVSKIKMTSQSASLASQLHRSFHCGWSGLVETRKSHYKNSSRKYGLSNPQRVITACWIIAVVLMTGQQIAGCPTPSVITCSQNTEATIALRSMNVTALPTRPDNGFGCFYSSSAFRDVGWSVSLALDVLTQLLTCGHLSSYLIQAVREPYVRCCCRENCVPRVLSL